MQPGSLRVRSPPPIIYLLYTSDLPAFEQMLLQHLLMILQSWLLATIILSQQESSKMLLLRYEAGLGNGE